MAIHLTSTVWPRVTFGWPSNLIIIGGPKNIEREFKQFAKSLVRSYETFKY